MATGIRIPLAIANVKLLGDYDIFDYNIDLDEDDLNPPRTLPYKKQMLVVI